MNTVGFQIGKGGIVYLLHENGKRQKCGFRIKESRIDVFDRRNSEWHTLPEQLTSPQKDGVINVIVIDTEEECRA